MLPVLFILQMSKIHICSECGKEISRNSKSGLCITCFNNQEIIRKKQEYIDKWLEADNLNLKGSPRAWIREYLLEQQNNKCAICKINQTWNGKGLVFICDHINGNHTDNSPDNLRMICPNCDSQLETYKSKNKGKGRQYDKEYRLNHYHTSKEV